MAFKTKQEEINYLKDQVNVLKEKIESLNHRINDITSTHKNFILINLDSMKMFFADTTEEINNFLLKPTEDFEVKYVDDNSILIIDTVNKTSLPITTTEIFTIDTD